MAKDLLIVGASSFAEIATLYFGRGDEYLVRAIVVEDAYWEDRRLLGIPVIPLSVAVSMFAPETTSFYAAIVYTDMNRLRQRLMKKMADLGYSPASYVSPHAHVDPTVEIGDHTFIFEDNTIQPFVKLGSNVVLWSGNHVGHHSEVEDNAFISSQVVISGHCQIGRNTFMGVNSSVGNNVRVGAFNWILPGTVILSETGEEELWRPQRPVLSGKRPPGL